MSYNSIGYVRETSDELVTQMSDGLETLLKCESGLRDLEKEIADMSGVDVKKFKRMMAQLKKALTEAMDKSHSVQSAFKQFHLELQQRKQDEHDESVNEGIQRMLEADSVASSEAARAPAHVEDAEAAARFQARAMEED